MSDNMNVPQLRFGEFDGKWEEKKYGDIYSFYTTNSFSREKLNYHNGEVKNIHYGDIHTKFSTIFELENENVPFINTDLDLSRIKEESYCQNGDLVIADASEDYADIGKTIEITNLNNEKVLAGLHTFLARPDKYDMALGYAGYLLQSWKVRWQVMRISQGTKVLSLSTGRLSNIVLTMPSKPEQQKIATFLSSVDTKIEQLTKKEKLLQEYKKGVMQKIFSREIRFKDDDGNEYPEWREKKLGESCEITTGKLDANAMIENGKYRFYTCAKDYYYINDYAFDTDALIISGNGANVGYIHYYKGKFNAYQRTYVLDSFSDNIIYIKYFLDKYLYKRIFQEKKEGNTPYIVMGTLSMMNIILPSLKEQTKIANFLSSIDSKIEQTQKQLNSTKEFKKALLQQMFV